MQSMLASHGVYTGSHPIEVLVERAQIHFDKMVRDQSKTLGEAITRYKRRYSRDPPPGFDKWFQVAQENDYVLVDEFDTIMESLEPFRGVAPSLLRQRVDSAADGGLLEPNRYQKPPDRRKVSHKEIWQAEIIDEWLEKPGWLDVLPDMVFLVNCYDEPRGRKARSPPLPIM